MVTNGIEQRAERLAVKLVTDLRGRAGFREAWEASDAEMRGDLYREFVETLAEALDEAPAPTVEQHNLTARCTRCGRSDRHAGTVDAGGTFHCASVPMVGYFPKAGTRWDFRVRHPAAGNLSGSVNLLVAGTGESRRVVTDGGAELAPLPGRGKWALDVGGAAVPVPDDVLRRLGLP